MTPYKHEWIGPSPDYKLYRIFRNDKGESVLERLNEGKAEWVVLSKFNESEKEETHT